MESVRAAPTDPSADPLSTEPARPRISPQAWLAFLVAFALMSGLNCLAIRNKTRLERLLMEQTILEKSIKVSEVVSRLLYKTQALRAMIVHNDGGVDGFDRVAMALMDDPALLNVLAAPDGVVSNVYPADRNERLLGYNLLGEGAGNREAIRARDTGELVFGGPFPLMQGGGQALVGRLPVWLGGRGPDEAPRFWGLVSVTLKYPEALEGAGLGTLETQGFGYRIWRVNPDGGERQTIAESPRGLNDQAPYIERPIEILNARWHFRIAPIREWYQYPEHWLLIAAGLCISLLIGGIVRNNETLKAVTRTLARQEAALRETAERARGASQLKTAFLANMSHELRTPMNGILGFSELAVGDPELPERARGYFDRIRASSSGLLHIVDNLLDISKIEAGRVELERIPFSLPELFAECSSAFACQAAEKGLDLMVAPPPPAAANLSGDPMRLRQVLFNLLANAVKFTPRGFIGVRAEPVRADADGIVLRFEVKDSGIGMSSGQIRRIFDPFIQADSSITRKYGGTGLGLAISRGLVELMGGKLAVESVPGVGSLFSFELSFGRPAAAPEGPRPADGGEAATRPVFSGEALVCEDNAINQEVLVEHLSRVGLRVAAVPDGQAGIEAFEARDGGGLPPFDIVFMDIHMPGMDGLAAARRLVDLGCEAPIVAVTANVMEGDRERYLQAGMVDCLGKPFQAAELWTCLRRHLTPVGETPLPGVRSGREGRGEVAAPAGGSVLNRSAGLARSAGNARLYARLLANFAHDFHSAAVDLRVSLAAGDRALAHRAAHSLKGVAATVGAMKLAEAARSVEASFRAGPHEPSPERLDALEAALAEVFAELDRNPDPPATAERAEPGALDPFRAWRLVRRLKPLLREGRAECREWADPVRELLGPLGSDAELLAAQINGFDFDPAMETLDRLTRALERIDQADDQGAGGKAP